MKKGTDSPQSGEGHMHEVCEIAAKMSRGFRERVQPWPKARITNTARTPTDKSVWGICKGLGKVFLMVG